MIKDDHIKTDNKRFIADISTQIEKAIEGVIDQLIIRSDVQSLVFFLRASIIQSKGMLKYMGQAVSLDTLVMNQHLRISVSSEPLFAKVQKIIANNKYSLMARGYREYPVLMLWDNGEGDSLQLRLSFFKSVRAAIINEIKKDEMTLKYIESNNQLFQH